MEPRNPPPSVGDLLQDLVGETATLVRQELTLARTEMAIKARSAALSTALVVTGLGVALVSLLGIGVTAAIMLAMVIPAALATFLVAAVFGLVAAGLIGAGVMRLRKFDPRPTETLASLRDVTRLPVPTAHGMWLKEGAR